MQYQEKRKAISRRILRRTASKLLRCALYVRCWGSIPLAMGLLHLSQKMAQAASGRRSRR
jgi:hypothetical protein